MTTFIDIVLSNFTEDDCNKLEEVCNAMNELSYDWEDPRHCDFAKNCIIVLENIKLATDISDFVDSNCDKIEVWNSPIGWDHFDAHSVTSYWKGLSVSKDVLRVCIMAQSIKMMIAEEVTKTIQRAIAAK